MLSIHPGRRGCGRTSLRATLAVAAVLATTAAAPAVANAGQYPMYAGDVPGVNLPAPSQGAWTFYDTSGAIRTSNELATKTQGASAFWQINYPTGVSPRS